MAAGALALPRAVRGRAGETGTWVNDVHGQQSPTRVREVVRVGSEQEVRAALRRARESGVPVCVAGGRHSMGGQPFATDALLLDARGLDRIHGLDAEHGIVETGAGVEWPALVSWLVAEQRGRPRSWGIRQKQTGADALTVGGALAANAHGRGLSFPPFVADVEAFTLIDPSGEERVVSRSSQPELFRLAVGGYGLFGIVTRVALRLTPRLKLKRLVEIEASERLAERFAERIRDGFVYGDFQFAVDPGSDTFLRRGVFSCYRPVDPKTPLSESPRELSPDDWRRLLRLAHAAPSRAFEAYASHYLATSGQVYWSDTHQLSVYLPDYHAALDREQGVAGRASEMISEVYVPRSALAAFLDDAARVLRGHRVPVIYGTIRLIERDTETLLAWAREPWACIVMNLHTPHTADGVQRSADAFRALYDLAIERGGSYFLTYHRWARRDQLLAAHPRFLDFLREKRRLDPRETLASDWYRHYRSLFAAELA